jgi:hypothetical protein
MAIDLISVGSSDNDGTGDTLRAGLTKANGMFTELYGATTQTVNFVATDTATEIQALIDAVPRYIPFGATVTFQFADGTYTLDTSLTWSGFYGGGTLHIYGNSANNTLSTTKSVDLDFNNDTKGIEINQCTCLWDVRYMQIEVDDGNRGVAVQQSGVNGVVQALYIILGGKSAGSSIGVSVNKSNTIIQDNYFNNPYYGILCTNTSHVFSYNNDDTGVAPTYGIKCDNAGTVGKRGTQPAGVTSAETAVYGGVIR